MYRNKDDKFGDPASWYESYHLKIDANVVQRVLGSLQDYLDPKWEQWATFVEALRLSFSNRVSREQAITDWHLLKHIDKNLEVRLVRLIYMAHRRRTKNPDAVVRSVSILVHLLWQAVSSISTPCTAHTYC